MEARKIYLDIQARQFVGGPTNNLAVSGPLFFDEDVESVELYFLRPTGSADGPVYDYVDYSANTVKFAVGTTTPAALQASWTALSTTVTATVTSLATGGSGTNEQQRLTFSQQPATGGFALQLPSRNVTVSSVSANIFTAADHGLYSGQSVSLTAFSFTASSVANGSSYFVIRNSKDTFSLASTAATTTALTASTTSGGGTVSLPAITTGQLAYNASPASVQNALVNAGLTINAAPQILVTGTGGKEYVLTYANGSASRDYDNVSIVGSTLLGAVGLQANVNFATSEVAALVADGTTTAKLEIEVSGSGRRQTYQTAVTLSADIITAGSSDPLALTTGNAFRLMSPNGTVFEISADNEGMLQSVSSGSTSAPSGLALRSANGTAFTLSVANDGTLTTTTI
jgi:hypothetical protein